MTLRYHSDPVPASVAADADGEAELSVELGRPFFAASPGQTAVLLSGEAIVGYGTLTG